MKKETQKKDFKYDSDYYLKTLKLLYRLCVVIKANPLSLESNIEKTDQSNIFLEFPKFIENKIAVAFICDILKIQISSPSCKMLGI